ncbi:Sec-independent protein translocase protein TatA [compost metagenome]
MNLGWTEIIMIGAIALLLFGPTKLPGLGRSLGEAIRGFKKSLTEDEPTAGRDVSQQITQNPETPMNQQTAQQTEAQKKDETHKS